MWKSKVQPSTPLSSAAAEMYALSEACDDARLRYWISEDTGYVEQWPAVIKVDNAAAMSFQQATTANSNTKRKGGRNLRAQEPPAPITSNTATGKAHAILDFPDKPTRRLAAEVRNQLLALVAGSMCGIWGEQKKPARCRGWTNTAPPRVVGGD